MAPFGAYGNTKEQLVWPYRALDFDLIYPLDLCRPAALVALFRPDLCLVAAEVRIRESTPKRISDETWAQLRPRLSACECNPTPEKSAVEYGVATGKGVSGSVFEKSNTASSRESSNCTIFI
jgi:hypothetical protein